jgi:hypothetical protein
VEYEPRDFVDEAARREDWTESEWGEWLNSGRVLFENTYGVATLTFVEFPPTIWASGPTFKATHVRVDDTAAQPIRKALDKVGRKLAKGA